MVVEDDVLVRSAIADYLRDAGFAVIEAANSTEATTVIASQAEVHVVFSDIQMPGGVDGIMLADWIDAHCPGVPVLLTSGTHSANTITRIAGRPFLSKPYVFDEVEKRLRELLRSHG
jgi:CheY-like chemotaxis protein